MKKILCLVLSFVMLFSLCACFDETETEDVRGEVLSETAEETKKTKNEDETKTKEETATSEEEPEFSMGKATNNVYRNKFLGLSCTLPSGWKFYSDEQILELNNITADVIDEDVANQLKEANIVYDMFASSEDELNNINVNLEKCSAIQLINIDLKEVLEAQIETIKSTYQSMGYTDINVGYVKVKVDGSDYDVLQITAKIQGLDFFANCFMFQRGNYLASVTVSSLLTNKNETILSYLDFE